MYCKNATSKLLCYYNTTKHWCCPKYKDNNNSFPTKFFPWQFPLFGQFSVIFQTAVKFPDSSSLVTTTQLLLLLLLLLVLLSVSINSPFSMDLSGLPKVSKENFGDEAQSFPNRMLPSTTSKNRKQTKADKIKQNIIRKQRKRHSLVLPQGQVCLPERGQAAHSPEWQITRQVWQPHDNSLPHTYTS